MASRQRRTHTSPNWCSQGELLLLLKLISLHFHHCRMAERVRQGPNKMLKLRELMKMRPYAEILPDTDI